MDGVHHGPSTEVKNLPAGLEWCTCDLANRDYRLSVSGLLTDENKKSNHETRIIFTTEYLMWSCCPPGYLPDLHIGITDSFMVPSGNPSGFTRRIIAFIAAVPIRVRVVNKVSRMAWIRMPVVHSDFRNQISINTLYVEAIRRVRRKNFHSILLQKGAIRAAPMTYALWQRPLNPQRLVQLKLLKIPGMAPSKIAESFKLPDSQEIPGLEKMNLSHVRALTSRLREYFRGFIVTPDFNEVDVSHWFLSNPRELHSYVVVEPDGSITGLCSYLIMDQFMCPAILRCVYSFYNFSIGIPLPELMKHALLSSKENSCDTFFACDAMDNECFLRELNFFPHGSNIQYDLGSNGLCTLNKQDMGLVLL